MSYSIPSSLEKELILVGNNRKVIEEISKSLVQLKRSLSGKELSFLLIHYFDSPNYNDALSFCSQLGMNITMLSKAIKKDSLLSQKDELILRNACNLEVTIPSTLIMRFSNDKINFSIIGDKVSIEFSDGAAPDLEEDAEDLSEYA